MGKGKKRNPPVTADTQSLEPTDSSSAPNKEDCELRLSRWATPGTPDNTPPKTWKKTRRGSRGGQKKQSAIARTNANVRAAEERRTADEEQREGDEQRVAEEQLLSGAKPIASGLYPATSAPHSQHTKSVQSDSKKIEDSDTEPAATPAKAIASNTEIGAAPLITPPQLPGFAGSLPTRPRPQLAFAPALQGKALSGIMTSPPDESVNTTESASDSRRSTPTSKWAPYPSKSQPKGAPTPPRSKPMGAALTKGPSPRELAMAGKPLGPRAEEPNQAPPSPKQSAPSPQVAQAPRSAFTFESTPQSEGGMAPDVEARFGHLQEEVQHLHKLLKEREAKAAESDTLVRGLYTSIRQREEGMEALKLDLQRRTAENAQLVTSKNQLSALESKLEGLAAKQTKTATEVGECKAENTRLRQELAEEKRVSADWSNRNLLLIKERGDLVRKSETLGNEVADLQSRLGSLELEASERKQENQDTLARLEAALRDVQRKDEELQELRERQGEAIGPLVTPRSVSAGTHGSLSEELAEMGESLADITSGGDSSVTAVNELAAKLSAASIAHAETQANLTAVQEQLAATASQRDAASQQAELLKGELEQAIQTSQKELQAQKKEFVAGAGKIAAERLNVEQDLRQQLAQRDQTVTSLEAKLADVTATCEAQRDAESHTGGWKEVLEREHQSQVEALETASRQRIEALETAHKEQLEEMKQSHLIAEERQRSSNEEQQQHFDRRIRELDHHVNEEGVRRDTAHAATIAALEAEFASATRAREAEHAAAIAAEVDKVRETAEAPIMAAPVWSWTDIAVIIAMLVLVGLWGVAAGVMSAPKLTIQASNIAATSGSLPAGWRVGVWMMRLTGVRIEDLVVGFYG